MHQSFSDNRLKSHAATRTTAARNADQMDTVSTPSLEPRRLWASEQGGGDVLLKWQNVILIQHGQDTGFTQAPPRAGVKSARSSNSEKYKGHVMQLLIEILPTESIGHMIQKALTQCYLPGSIVPTPDTLHYTLGEHPSHLVWTQDRRPFYDIQLNALTSREISLSHDDRLEWISQETTTIFVFLPPPDTVMALSPRSETEMLEVQQPGHAYLSGNGKSNSLSIQEQLYYHTPTLTRQREPHQDSQEHDLLQEETPPPWHQIFVRISDTWTDKERKPAFTQTMPAPTSLDTLKDGLSALLSIPTHHFNILYGGKILHSRAPLETQGVTKDTTVWLTIGGLLGGADTDMLDSPQLASSAPTHIHRPPPTNSHETQASIEEWIDRLRMSSPLTQESCHS